MQDFKKIAAWRKAHALLLNVHRAIRSYPRDYMTLRSQTRRAAESIPTNIVEGGAFDSAKQFGAYLQHSIASSSKLEYHLRAARDYDVLPERRWELLTRDTVEVRKMVTVFRKRVLGLE